MPIKKSLGINAILNAIKSVMNILFPLITFPYVSRVLQVENLGKYNFALSTVNYFILLAGLGISTYSIREGSRCRENKEQISRFASEVFTINIISMVVSYSLLAIVTFLIPKFHDYKLLIMIFSIEIIFRTIGTEWIYSIYEEYAYITIRSIIFQILSIFFLFLLVKKPDDYHIYAAITVFANAGNNIVNCLHVRKLCRIKIVRSFDWKKHLKSILIIFASSVATTIYVNSDVTILGFMTNDFHVGLYSVSVKVYKIIKTLLSAMLIVSIPRLSNYLGTGQKDRYNDTFNIIFNTMIVFVVPAVVGLFMLSEQIVLLISDSTFHEAGSSLKILSLALLVCLFGWLFTSCVLIPNQKEKDVLKATIASAVLNAALNLILIPFFYQDAAAFTTLLAEACSMIMCIYYSRGLVRCKNFLSNLLSVALGSVVIIFACKTMELLPLGTILHVLLSIIVSVGLYILVLYITKNPYLKKGLQLIKKN